LGCQNANKNVNNERENRMVDQRLHEEANAFFMWHEEILISSCDDWMGGWPIRWPMGAFPCISPWHEEANVNSCANTMNLHQLFENGRFLVNFPMKWKNKFTSLCDMKRHWLIEMRDGRMANMMVNGRIPMHFFMWHENALVGWDG
jgi:hypothetical protein